MPWRRWPPPRHEPLLQWGLDWLLKMQREDGWVYHKLSPEGFAFLFTLPENANAKRFYAAPGTAATVRGAGACRGPTGAPA